MARLPFQVLVIPFFIDSAGQPRYLLLKRSDLDVWQWIAGGGETGEAPEQTAMRECLEEAGIPDTVPLIELNSVGSVPAREFAEHHIWGPDIIVIPEYSFGVRVIDHEVRLSGEHSEYLWLEYEDALDRLEWDSNKIALAELHRRLISENGPTDRGFEVNE